MLALGQYEARICACGFHESLTGDPSNHFTFEERTCPVCRGSIRYGRMQHQRDQRLRKARGEDSVADPADGRRTLIRQMTTTEVQQRREAGRGNQA